MKKFGIIGSVILLVLVAAYYYLYFPAINIHQHNFWVILIVITALFSMVFMIAGKVVDFRNRMTARETLKSLTPMSKFFLILAVLCVGILMGGELLGATIFRSRSYAALMPIEECAFETDIEESHQVTDIALMDTESARIFGNRKIGSLSDVVSQYEVEMDYTQIAIQEKPMKVSALKYASFFKWWNNRTKGVPGYVKVDPTDSDAEYVKLKEGMRYVPSGYLNYNLQRHVQLKYPTKLIDGYHFEVDDEGNPYFICPTKTAKIGLFGGMDVNGAIICDPISGDCKYYAVEDCPAWVDCVYDGHLLTRKYNWNGMLSDGFLNSIFGQKGCKQTTDDFGYKIIGDDVWVYTGVTSVNGDQSNIGFVMMNQRTSEAKYYRVSGAEEHSAMAAAEGEVQEKGYRAAFPSLINVGGMPTYIMVLKDSGGLVKLYAMVNVEQYNIVATATTQAQVFENYRKLMASEGEVESLEKETQQKTITVSDIQFINAEDGTIVYLKDEAHHVYKQAFKDNEALIKISVGDQIQISYEEGVDGIDLLTEYSFSGMEKEKQAEDESSEEGIGETGGDKQTTEEDGNAGNDL